jgi:hypothetical protein
LDVAGQDADEFFEDIGHSNDAREELKKYLIGTFKMDEATLAKMKADAKRGSVGKAERRLIHVDVCFGSVAGHCIWILQDANELNCLINKESADNVVVVLM